MRNPSGLSPDFFENSVAQAAIASGARGLLIASVSGGADSTAMLVALAAARDRGLVSGLRCLHVEHGIRAEDESRGDRDFVRGLCASLRVPCAVATVMPDKIARAARKLGIGSEAAARLYRRRAWSRAMRGRRRARILVAHTRDDAVETALLRLLRGAGPAGLAAMPVSRGRILRPLLAFGRAEAREYLSRKKIAWREDSTNADPRYMRNRARLRLVPFLDGEFPFWRGALSSMAATQSLAARFISGEAARRIPWRPLPGARGEKFPEMLRVDEALFFSAPEILREEALFQGANALKPPKSMRRSEIRRAGVRLFAKGGARAADLGGAEARREGGEVILSRRKTARPASERGFALLIITPGSYTLDDMVLEARALAQGEIAGLGAGEFVAALPAVIRPSHKEDKIGRETGGRAGREICAGDALGTAALFDAEGRIAARREELPERPASWAIIGTRMTKNADSASRSALL